MFVLAMGKMGARELNYSSDIDLIVLFDETRHDPDDYAELRRGFIRVTQRLVKLLSRGHRRGLRLPHRPAAAPRPLGDAGLHRHRAGRALLRERRPHLGARRLHQGAGLRRGGRRRRGLPRAAAAVHLAPPPRLRGDRGRAGHAAAHPRPQGPGRAARDPRPRPQARPGRHPRDRVLHPDPPADRRRPRRGPAPARHAGGARGARRPGLGRPRRRRRRWPRPTSRTASSSTGCRCSRTPRPSACPRAAAGLARLADFCGAAASRPSGRPARPARDGARADRARSSCTSARPPATRRRPRRSSPTPAAARHAWPPGAPAGVPQRAGARDLPPARARADAPDRRAPPARTRRCSRSTPSWRACRPGVQIFSLMEANPPLLDLLVDICGTAPELARYLGRQRRGARRGDQPATSTARCAAPPSCAPSSPSGSPRRPTTRPR